MVDKQKRILAINTHPNLDGQHAISDIQQSFANRLVMDTLKSYPEVTTHSLIEKYPDKIFDLENERQLLMEHDLILFIGPVFWYSLPAIAKQWIDEVLLYGWAYGSKGKALEGKGIQLILTSGSDMAEYTHDDLGNTLEEFFSSYHRSFEYCKMNWLGIKCIGGITSVAKAKNSQVLTETIESFTHTLIKEHFIII